MDEVNRIKDRLEKLNRLLDDKDYYISDEDLWDKIQEKKWLEQELEEEYTRIHERDSVDKDFGVQLSEPDECEW